MALTKVTYSMIQGSAINVLDYGADPTGATDSAAAIEVAILAAEDNVLYFPDGEYLINTTIEVAVDNLTIDFGNAIILNTVAVSTFVREGLTINPIIYINGSNITVRGGIFNGLVSEGVRVEGTFGGAGTDYYKDSYCDNIRYENISFNDCINDVLSIRFFRNATIDNVFVIDANTLVVGASNIDLSYGVGANISNCQSTVESTDRAFSALYVESLNITNCSINPQRIAGLVALYYFSFCRNSVINNCTNYIDDSSGSSSGCMKFSHGDNLTASNCTFFAIGSTPYAGIQIQGAQTYMVANCTIKTENCRALRVYAHVDQNSTNGTITGNAIFDTTSGAVFPPVEDGNCIYVQDSTAFPRGYHNISSNTVNGGNIFVDSVINGAIIGNYIETGKDVATNRALIYLNNVCQRISIQNNFIVNRDTTVRAKIGVRVGSSSFITVTNNTVRMSNPAITGSVGYLQEGSPTLVYFGPNNAIDTETKYSGLAAGQYNDILRASAVVDVPSISNNESYSFNVTVNGASTSNSAMASCSQSLGGVAITASVTAADTVTITLINNTGSPVDIINATYTVRVVSQGLI
jgi:hypothetical protein